MKHTSDDKQEVKWTKAQIAASSKFTNRLDVLNAVLVDGQEYTIESVEAMIEKYMKGGVK